MERGDLAADVTMQRTVRVLFKNYLRLHPFDGLGLNACSFHPYRSGALFLGEDGRGRKLPFCCGAEAEIKLSEQRGQNSPEKAFVVGEEERSASTADKEQREFKAQSHQLAGLHDSQQLWVPLFFSSFSSLKWKLSQAAEL